MITIDGSFGEGGGQILRTSLALSVLTGIEFEIVNIRAKRKKPGLLNQHLTSVLAAGKISNSKTEGAYLGSKYLYFCPSNLRHGNYGFDVKTAGSSTLVLQTILPCFFTGNGESEITIEGGTHNPFAPPFNFLAESFFNILKKMNINIQYKLLQYGFYPAGKGKIKINIKSSNKIHPLHINNRGKIILKKVDCFVSQLPIKIPENESKIIQKELGWPDKCFNVYSVNSLGPGNVVTAKIESENITEVFTAFGEKGKPLKKVSMELVNQVKKYIETDIPVDEYLQDQLLIPFCLAGEGSFITLKPSMHTITNIEVIKKFINIDIEVQKIENNKYKIDIIS